MKLGKKVKEYLREEFLADKRYGDLTPGKALKIYRELNELTQNELANVTGLKQATISSLEHGRVTMGIDRAKILGRALNVHPGLLAFADWDSSKFVA